VSWRSAGWTSLARVTPLVACRAVAGAHVEKELGAPLQRRLLTREVGISIRL
jgi:hypothetical protein